MATVLTVLTVIVSVLLICVVLVQKSKGGGLSSSFAGNNQIMGVRRTNDFIEKTTWVLAIIILFLSVAASLLSSSKDEDGPRLKTNEPTQNEAVNFPTADTDAPMMNIESNGAAEPGE